MKFKTFFNWSKKEAGINFEGDIEGMQEKHLDYKSKKPEKKTRYQIKQEEYRKNEELKHKQQMEFEKLKQKKQRISLYITIGAFALILLFMIIMAALESSTLFV